MGKNKLKKFEDMDSYPHVFQFPFSKIQEQGFHLKNHWHTNFFQNNHPIVLELGCGKGEYTVELAKLFPEKNFIGIDIKGARMWTGAKASLEQKMNNVAFIRTNIELITHFFWHKRSVRDMDNLSRPANEKSEQAINIYPLYGTVQRDSTAKRADSPKNRQSIPVYLYTIND